MKKYTKFQIANSLKAGISIIFEQTENKVFTHHSQIKSLYRF